MAISTASNTNMPDQLLKSTKSAYLLWLLLGCIGMHNWYLDKVIEKNCQLGLAAGGMALLSSNFYGLGFLGEALLVIYVCWLIVDLFLIPGAVKKANLKIIEKWEDSRHDGK